MIAIGSLNQTKVNAVAAVFKQNEVITIDAPSAVSSQPFSDEETQLGAINRAKFAKSQTKALIGVGLEGGVMFIGQRLYLTNWGALIDETDTIYLASGARFPLPEVIKQGLLEGKELAIVMDHYTGTKGIRHREGAVGVFTNELLTRQMMFEHVLLQLQGQKAYHDQLNK